MAQQPPYDGLGTFYNSIFSHLIMEFMHSVVPLKRKEKKPSVSVNCIPKVR